MYTTLRNRVCRCLKSRLVHHGDIDSAVNVVYLCRKMSGVDDLRRLLLRIHCRRQSYKAASHEKMNLIVGEEREAADFDVQRSDELKKFQSKIQTAVRDLGEVEVTRWMEGLVVKEGCSRHAAQSRECSVALTMGCEGHSSHQGQLLDWN